MNGISQKQGLWASVREVFLHGAVALTAVAIAFSLPVGARYILFDWWPKVEAQGGLLLLSELALASTLVLMFNLVRIAWHNKRNVGLARLASLVHARNGDGGRLLQWLDRKMIRGFPVVRDAFVLTLTGFDTFIDKRSLLRESIEQAYEIRVMLVNPAGEGLRRHVATLPQEITLLSLQREIQVSLEYLSELRKIGRKVTLRFYDKEPFWKVIVLGEHVWVQYCHSGLEVKRQPEYVFALQRHNPRQGLFVPFYMHFLELWNDNSHPEYDFDTGELVYRDAAGNDVGRASFEISHGAAPVASGAAACTT